MRGWRRGFAATGGCRSIRRPPQDGPSATLHELGALVQRELQVDSSGFVAAASAARFGPPAGAARAARDARRELRSLLRRMRLRLTGSDRARGLLSLRSFGFVS